MFSNTNIFIGLYNKLSIVARMFVEIIYTFPKDHIHIIKLGYSSSVMSEWTLPQTNEDISKGSTKSSEMYRAGNLLDQVKPTQLPLHPQKQTNHFPNVFRASIWCLMHFGYTNVSYQKHFVVNFSSQGREKKVVS